MGEILNLIGLVLITLSVCVLVLRAAVYISNLNASYYGRPAVQWPSIGKCLLIVMITIAFTALVGFIGSQLAIAFPFGPHLGRFHLRPPVITLLMVTPICWLAMSAVVAAFLRTSISRAAAISFSCAFIMLLIFGSFYLVMSAMVNR